MANIDVQAPEGLAVPPGADPVNAPGLRQILAPRWRSIAALAAVTVVAAVALLVALPRPHADAVRVVNPQAAIKRAQSMPQFPVYTPSPLPAGWYPNSARFGHDWIGAMLHIGYLAPDGGYAGLEETTGANKRIFVSTISAGAIFDSLVTIDGVVWAHLNSDRKKQDSLVWYGPRSVVIVTGTTSVANLEEFAASLHVGS
jgi:hypothetical protein